jgi:hypothetical protein
MKQGTLMLKNLVSGEQEEMKVEAIISKLQ